MRKNRENERKREKRENQRARRNEGITLIALVITIIVLLILAGVTIATLTGENGILTRASEASAKTEEANAKEQVQIAVTGSLGTDGMLENESLKNNLNQIENVSGVPEKITDGSYPLTVTVDGEYSYVINKDGTIGEVVTREGIKVGDYVNYTYDTKAEGYNLKAAESGYSDQTVNQKSGMKWRILNIHPDGRVDLIGDVSSSDQTVDFKGALGYNNGVYLLNDICKELYSNDSLGVYARSVDLEDIESQMNEETGIAARDAYTGTVKYGETKTCIGSYANYPNLYAQENGSGINLTGETEKERKEQTKADGIGVNDDGYTSPTEETSSKADSLTVTQSFYSFSNTPASYFKDYNGSSSTVRDMLFNTGTYYWLASRYARCDSAYADFGLRNVYSSDLGGNIMFYSYGTAGSNGNRVRPVVSLGFDIKITACEGENSSTNMHQISK